MFGLSSNSHHQNTRPSIWMEGVRGQHEHHNRQNNDMEGNNGWSAILHLQLLQPYAATCVRVKQKQPQSLVEFGVHGKRKISGATKRLSAHSSHGQFATDTIYDYYSILHVHFRSKFRNNGTNLTFMELQVHCCVAQTLVGYYRPLLLATDVSSKRKQVTINFLATNKRDIWWIKICANR